MIARSINVTKNKDLDFFEQRGSSNGHTDRSKVGNQILRSLPARHLGIIEPYLKKVSLTSDQFIYQEEARLDYIYFPETAVVSEFKMLDDGRMVEIAVTGKEGAIGLSAIITEQDSATNCTQVTQSGLADRIETGALRVLLKRNDDLRLRLGRSVQLYIRQISQKALCNMYHSVKERLCTWLLMLNDRCGKKTMALTHEQIARVLGVYRPSVTCIAQELRQDHLINYSRGGISICNRMRVEESACACYFEMISPAPVF